MFSFFNNLNYILPPSFFDFLNLTYSFSAKVVGLIALFLLLRTLIVFLKTQRLFKNRRSISIKSLKKLASKVNKSLPFFTVLVPARNEADVVEATIKTLSKLDYPNNKYEIIIVTDEKELIYNQGEVTTQEVIEKTISEIKKNKPNLKVSYVNVVNDFDGKFLGKCTGKEVKSTKGRALNYVLTKYHSEFNKNTDFFAFFDTDDHPSKKCLIEIAKAYLEDEKNQVFQLPVYQCRNLFDINAFNKVVALGQCFTHENFLPYTMKWLPFLGGTNLFISKDILFLVEGFSCDSITEDLDLGVEIYLRTGYWPQFLPLPSSEQTPGTFKAYYRQRHRWALGQVEIIYKLTEQAKSKGEIGRKSRDLQKKLFLYGPGEWTLFFLVTLFGLILIISRLLRSIFLAVSMISLQGGFSGMFILKEFLIGFISVLGVPMFLFTIFLYFRYFKYIDKVKNQKLKLIWFFIQEILFLPFVLFLYPTPFVMAFFEYVFGVYKKKEMVWVKTPRTKEKK